MNHAELALSSTLTVPPHVLARQAAGETVLMNLDNEQYYSLDGPGNRLWELLGTQVSFGNAVDSLLEEYEVDREVLMADMTELVNDLLANGLVVLGSDAGRD
jgi:Coenzyme PQQ synthesis protein D (PqqD)